MNTWFNTDARIDALEAEADKWIGTPFRNNSAVRGAGGGVSCHNLVGELYFAVGTVPRFKLPLGSARLLQTSQIADLLLRYLDENLGDRFTGFPVTEKPLPGDLVVIEDVRTIQHLGILLRSNLFVHVLKVQGVMLSLAIDPTFSRRVVEIRRPNL